MSFIQSQNEIEYDEICKIIESYEEYLKLKDKYFSSKDNNAEKPIEERNAEFLQNWQAKKAKIKARMKKNNYFVRNGRIGDEKTLRQGELKYSALLTYYSLDSEFLKLAQILTENPDDYMLALNEHINQLRIKKQTIEQQLGKLQ